MDNSLNYHRTKAIELLPKYIKGQLTEDEKKEYHYHVRQATEAQREIDNKYKSKSHSPYYDLMNK